MSMYLHYTQVWTIILAQQSIDTLGIRASVETVHKILLFKDNSPLCISQKS